MPAGISLSNYVGDEYCQETEFDYRFNASILNPAGYWYTSLVLNYSIASKFRVESTVNLAPRIKMSVFTSRDYKLFMLRILPSFESNIDTNKWFLFDIAIIFYPS